MKSCIPVRLCGAEWFTGNLHRQNTEQRYSLLFFTVPINWIHLIEVRKHSHQNHPVTHSRGRQSAYYTETYNAE